MIQGIAVSPGISIAKAFVIKEEKREIFKGKANKTEELEKLQKAIQETKVQLNQIKEQAAEKLAADKLAVFDVHIMFMDDPDFIDAIKEKISDEEIAAAYATEQEIENFVNIFSSMDDEYMRERAADIHDVGNRLLNNLLGIKSHDISSIQEKTVLIAEDLTPSQTALIDKNYVQGFATDIGGRTSHSAIMARTLEIPAVVGTKEVTSKVSDGDFVIIDAFSGKIFVNPTPELISAYQEKAAGFEELKKELAELKDKEAVTTDEHTVELASNIGSPKDLEGCLKNGAEAIGLYRTEFLYMDRPNFPNEDEQFDAYKKVAEGMEGKPVIIRTLDIGGDKELDYFDLPKEMNPFLGYRAIRLCLQEDEIFNTQLRAILRASHYGKIRIMFPMISNLVELRTAKEKLEKAKAELRRDEIAFDENIEVGIMVEIPSVAVMADMFVDEVDFFSIGTNDLCQYTMAVDRMNEKISALYRPFSPAILRLVKSVIDAAHSQNKFAGMCGEMAGDPMAVLLLTGMGLDELSMSASSIPYAKSVVRSVSFAEAKEIADHALTLKTAEEIIAFLASKIETLKIKVLKFDKD